MRALVKVFDCEKNFSEFRGYIAKTQRIWYTVQKKGTRRMKYDYVLWDFNGTLLDDVDICVDCLNALLKSHGMKGKTEEEYKSIFTFPIKEYYERAGFDFEIVDYNSLAREWTDYYRSRTDLVLFDGTERALKRISENGLRQSIISASEKSALFEQTKILGIDGYFSEMLGLDNIHARSKEAVAREWRRKNSDARAVFIGDTTHDKDVADAIDADCILIPRGHQLRKTLEKAGATIFEDIESVADFIISG